MFALGSQTINTDDEIDYFGIGLEMTESCMEIYKQTKTGLGGEAFVIEDGKIKPLNLTYTQRPEVIESVFYMWRYSHDEKYREFGRTMLDNIDKHLYNPVAYHTMNELGEPTDRMETFFLAETLKYLYLLFCQDDIVSLNDYVFNTEAHPISIRGKGQRSDPSKWVPIKETSEYLPPVGTLKPESNI